MTSDGDVNMALRGLGALCHHAATDRDGHVDDEHMLWFIGTTLADLAARLEARGVGDATKCTVAVSNAPEAPASPPTDTPAAQRRLRAVKAAPGLGKDGA